MDTLLIDKKAKKVTVLIEEHSNDDVTFHVEASKERVIEINFKAEERPKMDGLVEKIKKEFYVIS